MVNEGLMLEYNNMKQAGAPKDLNASALVGARISMAEGFRCAIVVSFGDSVGAVVDLSLKQHDAPSAGTSKALNIKNSYYVKAGAATKFSVTDIRSDDSGLSDTLDLAADFAAQEGIVVLEVKAEDLDRDGGFSHISLDIADTTAAKICSVNYILRDVKKMPAYEGDL